MSISGTWGDELTLRAVVEAYGCIAHVRFWASFWHNLELLSTCRQNSIFSAGCYFRTNELESWLCKPTTAQKIHLHSLYTYNNIMSKLLESNCSRIAPLRSEAFGLRARKRGSGSCDCSLPQGYASAKNKDLRCLGVWVGGWLHVVAQVAFSSSLHVIQVASFRDTWEFRDTFTLLIYTWTYVDPYIYI